MRDASNFTMGMPTSRLAAYLFVGGAIPGLFLGNASTMFFGPNPPPMLWLQGLLLGGVIGVVLALMISAAGRPKAA